jgi:hypothetical protein
MSRFAPAPWLTEQQEQAVRWAYGAGLTRTEAAVHAGITRQLLDTRLRDQLADLRPGRGKRRGKRVRSLDPTPDELLWLIAEARARWTPAIEESRRVTTWAILEGRWDGIHDLGDRVRRVRETSAAAAASIG